MFASPVTSDPVLVAMAAILDSVAVATSYLDLTLIAQIQHGTIAPSAGHSCQSLFGRRFEERMLMLWRLRMLRVKHEARGDWLLSPSDIDFEVQH